VRMPRDHDVGSKLQVTATVADRRGVEARRTFVLRPRTARLRLESRPAGARVAFGESSRPAPLEREAAVGFAGQLQASASFEDADGRRWEFSHWSDGGARIRRLAVPAGGLDLVAHYVAR
jgi:hypothetical protein